MFLDREPYIRWWRPTYRVLGPAIRRMKGAVLRTGHELPDKRLAQIEARLEDLQAAQQQFQTAIEQILVAALADRQLTNGVANLERRLVEMQKLQRRLIEMQELAARENTAQSAALEQLLTAFTGTSWATTGEQSPHLPPGTRSAGSARGPG